MAYFDDLEQFLIRGLNAQKTVDDELRKVSRTKPRRCPSCGATVPTDQWDASDGICKGCAAAIGELPA